MVYTVSVFREAKSGPSLYKITEIPADKFETLWDGRVRFYNVETRFFRRDKRTLVAELPPHTWIVSY